MINFLLQKTGSILNILPWENGKQEATRRSPMRRSVSYNVEVASQYKTEEVWWRELYQEEYYRIAKGQQCNYTHQATELKTHEAKWKALRQRPINHYSWGLQCPASNSRTTRQNQSEDRWEMQSTNKTKLAYFKKILLSKNITNPSRVCGIVIKV